MASWSPAPTIGSANWQGNAPLVTKRQLVSTTAGILLDLNDFTFSTISVSTLTVPQWVSTSVLYVSDIQGGGLQVNNGLLQISTGDFSFVSLSTLQLKGLDIGGINLSFNLGLGEAIGGALAGLGAAVGGAFVGIGTGVGLTLQGLETGLAALINGRAENFINNSYFETVNGSTQLQLSTLGNAFPLYSSIFRTVSSSSANTVPGPQIFTSTFFTPGTTCIRSVSDPLSIITGDSNIATSTIQSFGQWVPFLDPTVTGEDISARNAQFSSLTLSNQNLSQNPILMDMSNTFGQAQILSLIDTPNNSISAPVPFSQRNLSIYTPRENFFANRVDYNYQYNFISTAFTQYTSTIGNYSGGAYFINSSITSNLSTLPKFTWNGTGIGNFAICESNVVNGNETGFLSSYTMDFVANSDDLVIQWGLAVDNRNSTIAQGTGKRVTWNNTANTSNFSNIPIPQSTMVSNVLATVYLYNQPYESVWEGLYSGTYAQGGMAFSQKPMIFGSNTSLNNQPGYDYQFNGNVFVTGILEADSIIATSSIVNVSTNIQTYFSTQTFDADLATISTANVNSFLNAPVKAYISSLSNNEFFGNDMSVFAFDTYVSRNDTIFVSTLVLDYQLLGNISPAKAYLQQILGSNGAYITTDTGNFKNVNTSNQVAASTLQLSTIQEIGLTSLINYPGVITSLNTASGTTAPVVGIGFKAQIFPDVFNQTRVDYNWDRITGTSNGLTFFPFGIFTQTDPIPWSIQNVGVTNTSTLNVNTISTTTHNGNNITANFITVNSNLNFPSVLCNATPLTMTLSNTNSSNYYTALQANIIQGAAFPQQSNTFQIITSGSNTTIQDKQGLVFDVTSGQTVTFTDNIETVTLVSADLQARSVKYGTLGGGFLQPRAFRQQTTVGFGTGQSINTNVQVQDSNSNTFLYDNYNLMTCLASFYVDNSAIAFNEVVLAPFNSNGYWWVNLTARVNAGAAGADGTFSWNNLLFPYNMVT